MLFHLFIFQRLQIALALLACALFFYSFWKKILMLIYSKLYLKLFDYLS